VYEPVVERWNHNIHYHPRILAAVPHGCARALDVGCGEGTLARELRERVARVTGIDLDVPSIESAQAVGGDGIDYVNADFLRYPFEPESFDFIVSVAALHHMDMRMALERMRALLRAGGTLAVIGLARSQHPVDLPRDVVAVVWHRVLASTHTYWEHPSPTVWPPPETFASARRIAECALPGVSFRRHLLWRYSLRWTKPSAT
jgi:2-polyprenyl-3-methyl-5-hydroxy-6-metoxy-1,4-benzoquinol methylase